MKSIEWNDEKNLILQKERGVCFEDVVVCVMNNRVLDIIAHPNREKYPHQRIFVIEIDGYVYLVPFIEDEETLFLKTIIPSRKMTKKYLIEGSK